MGAIHPSSMSTGKVRFGTGDPQLGKHVVRGPIFQENRMAWANPSGFPIRPLPRFKVSLSQNPHTDRLTRWRSLRWGARLLGPLAAVLGSVIARNGGVLAVDYLTRLYVARVR